MSSVCPYKDDTYTPVTAKDISSAQIVTGSHYIIYVSKKVHVVLVKV